MANDRRYHQGESNARPLSPRPGGAPEVDHYRAIFNRHMPRFDARPVLLPVEHRRSLRPGGGEPKKKIATTGSSDLIQINMSCDWRTNSRCSTVNGAMFPQAVSPRVRLLSAVRHTCSRATFNNDTPLFPHENPTRLLDLLLPVGRWRSLGTCGSPLRAFTAAGSFVRPVRPFHLRQMRSHALSRHPEWAVDGSA